MFFLWNSVESILKIQVFSLKKSLSRNKIIKVIKIKICVKKSYYEGKPCKLLYNRFKILWTIFTYSSDLKKKILKCWFSFKESIAKFHVQFFLCERRDNIIYYSNNGNKEFVNYKIV